MATVLVIDDSPTQVACLRELLRGPRILHRSSASLHQGPLVPEPVDLVLIALILTRDNGFECGHALRELGYRNIVLYSDCPEDTDEDWARAIGLQGLVQLPAPAQLLRQHVNSYLHSGAQGQEDDQRWAS